MYIGTAKLSGIELKKYEKAVLSALAGQDTDVDKISHAQALEVLERVKSDLDTEYSQF